MGSRALEKYFIFFWKTLLTYPRQCAIIQSHQGTQAPHRATGQATGREGKKIMSVQRYLNLTIDLRKNGFEVTMHEPESGETNKLRLPYSREGIGHGIQDELFSWVSLWAEENGIDFPGRW